MNNLKDIVEKIRHSYYGIMKIVGFIMALLIVVSLMPRNVKFKYEYQKMRPWPHESLYAPFNFPIYKSDEAVKKEKEEALSNIEPIFVYDALGTEDGREKLLKDFDTQWIDTIGDKDYYENLILNIYDHIENTGIVAKNDRTNNFKGDARSATGSRASRTPSVRSNSRRTARCTTGS